MSEPLMASIGHRVAHIDVGVSGELATVKQQVDLALAFLRPRIPEPAFGRRHGEHGTHLDDPVGSLGQLQLRTRFVEERAQTYRQESGNTEIRKYGNAVKWE
jgi:hypothetical protein